MRGPVLQLSVPVSLLTAALAGAVNVLLTLPIGTGASALLLLLLLLLSLANASAATVHWLACMLWLTTSVLPAAAPQTAM